MCFSVVISALNFNFLRLCANQPLCNGEWLTAYKGVLQGRFPEVTPNRADDPND